MMLKKCLCQHSRCRKRFETKSHMFQHFRRAHPKSYKEWLMRMFGEEA